MKKARYYFVILALLFLVGCTNSDDMTYQLKKKDEKITELQNEIINKDSMIATLQAEKKVLEEEVSNEKDTNSDDILVRALQGVKILKDKDMESLAALIHQEKGVRFSPYAYVNQQEDIVLSKDEIINALDSDKMYIWGSYDGIGDPIELTFDEYYDSFIYDEDYANPHIIGNNVVVGTGTTLNNIGEAYPKGQFVEFHFTGFNPQFTGMDWRSLRLVFEEVEGVWYLVGIVHDEWTI